MSQMTTTLKTVLFNYIHIRHPFFASISLQQSALEYETAELLHYLYVLLQHYLYVLLQHYLYVLLHYLYVLLQHYLYVLLHYLYVLLQHYLYVMLQHYLYVLLQHYLYVLLHYLYVLLLHYLHVFLSLLQYSLFAPAVQMSWFKHNNKFSVVLRHSCITSFPDSCSFQIQFHHFIAPPPVYGIR